MPKIVKSQQDEALELRDKLGKTKNPKKRKKIMDKITDLAKFSHTEFEGIE